MFKPFMIILSCEWEWGSSAALLDEEMLRDAHGDADAPDLEDHNSV